ncbi:hypothetical protein DV711_11630 [Motiliproteus coralliicola]|uniref:DUF1496 domain-containing protein n=1 Tax=Motiliproteus coralliicola TaxID=2283196 RepID=A0A369WE07_9GAMM|nr:hypothetical protein [Motiliproteus coralliicola]RDE19533.1 hypothetical protein DV711_11630 [Motiliproteus coralliicola]
MKLAYLLGLAIAWNATVQAAEPTPETLPESLIKKLRGGSTITIYPMKTKPIQSEKEKGCGIKRECFLVQYGDGALREECYVIKDCHL